MRQELGNYLKLKRGEKSLRQVEDETDISNAYVSQLERGLATNPSPSKLHKLAECYGCSYIKLMELAGYGRIGEKTKEDPIQQAQIALMSSGLSQDQVKQVMDYINFIKSQKN